MVMLSAIVMGWLRLKSRSVWPSALVHATHNGVIQNFFDHITTPKAYSAWFVGEFGCALLLPIGLMARYSWRDLRSVEAVRAAEPALLTAAPPATVRRPSESSILKTEM